MRFNKQEILTLASQPSDRFDKEGVLVIKEKQDGFFKRGEVASERWCRLRGNLLFYLKTREHWSEAAGVIILENYVIQLDHQTEGPYGFIVVFEGDRSHQWLAAHTEADRNAWIEALHMASYSYLRSQMLALQQQIQQRLPEGVDDSPQPEWGGKELPFAELVLSCDNLRCDGHGRLPNAVVTLHLMSPPDVIWRKYYTSDVVEGSSNPSFISTVLFYENSSWKLTDATKIRASVHDVRERMTRTHTLLGMAMCKLSELQENRRLRLSLNSPEGRDTGFITITVAKVIVSGNVVGTKSCTSSPQEEQVPPMHRRSLSLPVQLRERLVVPSEDRLSLLYSNPCVKSYRLQCGLGGDISALEIMSEARLAFAFPLQLMKVWVLEEKELMREMASLGNLQPAWHQRQATLLNHHMDLLYTYTHAMESIRSNRGKGMRQTVDRNNKLLEWVPINLHLQRMWAVSPQHRAGTTYDVITVGAFTAHTHTQKIGGLLKMLQLQRSRRYEESISDDAWKYHVTLTAEKLSLACDAVHGVKSLRQEIVEDMRQLMAMAKTQNSDGILDVAEELTVKARLLSSICDPVLIEEAFQFLESVRQRQKSKPSTASADREMSPLRSLVVGKSPKVVHKVLGDYPPNLDPQCQTCTLHKQTQQNEEDPDPVVGENPEEDPKPEPNDSDLRFSVEDPEEGSEVRTSENPGVEEEAATPTDDSRHQVCDNEGENNNMEHPYQPHTPICFDCASSYSNSFKSHEELEPLDLIQVNIKASVMCLCSKVKLLGQQSRANKVPVEWASELRPSMRKLRHAMDGLLSTARIAHSVFRLQESSHASGLAHSISYRRRVCLSQSLSTLVTGLLTRLWCREPDPLFIETLNHLGPLAVFEGLLSLYGPEAAMWQDYVIAVEDLESVQFTLVPAGPTLLRLGKLPVPTVEGGRSCLRVNLPTPDAILANLPPNKKLSFSVTPVFFNVGIDQNATLAESLGLTKPQEQMNQQALDRLYQYYQRFHMLHSNLDKMKRHELSELMERLTLEVHSDTSKNVAILQFAERVTAIMGGLRFTSCKSAKDRTGMAVTLEQAIILSHEHGLASHLFRRALDTMRSCHVADCSECIALGY